MALIVWEFYPTAPTRVRPSFLPSGDHGRGLYALWPTLSREARRCPVIAGLHPTIPKRRERKGWPSSILPPPLCVGGLHLHFRLASRRCGLHPLTAYLASFFYGNTLTPATCWPRRFGHLATAWVHLWPFTLSGTPAGRCGARPRTLRMPGEHLGNTELPTRSNRSGLTRSKASTS